MGKKIIMKGFKVLVHFDGPKMNKTDITVKSALLCTQQPVILFLPREKGIKMFMPFLRILVRKIM